MPGRARGLLLGVGVANLPIELDYEFGCWLWRGSLMGRGYGEAVVNGRRIAAHLYVWGLIKKITVPSRLQLDHMCRRLNCVRPEHLEIVTPAENMRRTFARYRRGIERCPEDHRLDEYGKTTPEGGVVCRICSDLPLLARSETVACPSSKT